MTVAALYVDPKGSYAGLPGVELWDERRDARQYPGPHAVIAHPPCSRWCRLAGLVEARWGHKKGDDGGCFRAALDAVQRWGGVLEHPAYSSAWGAHYLPRPNRYGRWQGGILGGWSCHVEQGRYGHPAKKATWLYVFGVDPPELRWGWQPDTQPSAAAWRGQGKKRKPALVSWCGNHTSDTDDRPRIGKKAAAATPVEFRDVLLGIARAAGGGA